MAARLVSMWQGFHPVTQLQPKQMPLIVEDNLAMVMDISGLGALNESPLIKGPELQEFTKKMNLLSKEELKNAFEVSYKQMQTILDHSVPCIGCRRSVERLFYDLSNLTNHQPTLDPIIITPEAELTIKDEVLRNPQRLCTLLHNHSSRLSELVEQQTRNKKSHRCILHSLEMQRMKPPPNAWKEVWDSMEQECLKEITFIDAETLEVTLDTYLHKHKFCSECRTKVLLASSLLTTEGDPTKEKGYKSSLYSDIKRCAGGHVHLPLNIGYVSALVGRAQPELMGRERHAKTLEIAQEEVLTCLGICVAERLNLIYRRLREEEIIIQILAAVAVDALSRHFHLAVYIKEGITQLEIYFNEELVKLERRLKLRLKRKVKKERRSEKKRKEIELEIMEQHEEKDPPEIEKVEEDHKEEEEHVKTKQQTQQLIPGKATLKQNSSKSVVSASEVSQESKVASPNKKKNNNKQVVTSTAEESRKPEPEDADLCSCPTDRIGSSININNNVQPKAHSQPQQDKVPAKKPEKIKSKKQNVETKTEKNNSTKRDQNSCRSPKKTRNNPEDCNNLCKSDDAAKAIESCESNEVEETSANKITILPKVEVIADDPNDKEIWIQVKKRLDNRTYNKNSRSSSQNSRDCGYSSENNVSSSSLPCTPEGSEVACGDNCCNHEGDCRETKSSNTLARSDSGVSFSKEPGKNLTLLQMLENFSDENSFIPAEEVNEFQSKINQISEKRQELRQTLKRRFALLCSDPKPLIIPR